MQTSDGLVPRRLLPVAVQRCAESPVVLLEGPRTVGKSTLLRELAAQLSGRILDLDDLATRAAAVRDPALLLDGPGPVLIDEYQHVPEVLDAIKTRLNRSSEPGQFVLTGSARHESLPRAAQSLTGRLQRLPILPLSQAELAGSRADLLARLLDAPEAAIAAPESTTRRDDYIDRVVQGGFPLALTAATPASRGRWMSNFVRLTLERDVQELSRIRQARALPALLQRIAGQTSQVLNNNHLAEGLGLDEKTARDYIRLLEAVFLVRTIPVWDRTITKRTTARPKIQLLDSGIAARLLRLTASKLSLKDPVSLTQFGHLLEGFVVSELLTQATWTETITDAGHWRTRDGDEVDLVLEADDGRVLAFEVKSAGRVSGADLRALAKLRDLVGSAFVAGVACYTGTRSYTYDDRLHVLPVDRLWA